MFPPKRFDKFPLSGGCSEGLHAFIFFVKLQSMRKRQSDHSQFIDCLQCMVTDGTPVNIWCVCENVYSRNFGALRAVLMGTKSCTKILIFSTRFSCENLAVEDFVTLFMGKKSC